MTRTGQVIRYIRGVAIHVFASNHHGTGTSVWLHGGLCKCGVGLHSVNMANVKACFGMRNLKLEVGVPPGQFS